MTDDELLQSAKRKIETGEPFTDAEFEALKADRAKTYDERTRDLRGTPDEFAHRLDMEQRIRDRYMPHEQFTFEQVGNFFRWLSGQ